MLDFELQTKLEECLKKSGFEYEGKIVNYKRINGEDRLNKEHHFALIIGE